MDPATILSVTATCAKIAKTAWDLGEALYTFTKDAKVINKTLNSLIEQSRAVRDPCELLAVFLKGVGQDVDAHPAWAATCHGTQLGNTLNVLQRQLDGCEATLEGLSETTEGIRSTNTASAKKAWATFKFNLCKESMREHRSQLSVHLIALNTSLHILSCNIMYLTRQPEHPPDNLREEIDALRQQITELELQPIIPLDSIEHSQLLILARDTVSEGETVYAQSIAGGSELGDPREANSGQQPSVYAWLHRQVFEASQRVARDGDSTKTLPSPNCGASSDAELDCWDHDTISAALEDPDYELDLERSMISTLLNATAAIRDLPSISPGSYDFFELQYMLSVATFYATERKNAQGILLDFVRQQASSDQQRFCIAHASQLLAEAYVNLGNLEAAKSSCANALRIRHRLPGSDQLAKDQCYALAAGIETILDNEHRAETLLYNVSSANLDVCNRRYLGLAVSKSFSTEQRYALYLKEKKLFQGYSVIKDTGRLEEIPGEAAQKNRSHTKMTPLHFAVIFRDTEHASVLIEAGADVNAEAAFGSADAPSWHTGDGLTPLMCALLIRDKDMARLLVSRGANLSLPSASRAHAVALLFGVPYELDTPPCSIASMFECIKELGWDPDFVLDNTGQTLLHTAARLHDVDLTEVLLDLGASLLIKDTDAHIPLHIALDSKRNVPRRLRNLDMLLERYQREQLDSRDKEGRTALHCVLTDSDPATAAELAQYLTARGSNLLAKDNHGDIPLNVAIRHHNSDFDF